MHELYNIIELFQQNMSCTYTDNWTDNTIITTCIHKLYKAYINKHSEKRKDKDLVKYHLFYINFD